MRTAPFDFNNIYSLLARIQSVADSVRADPPAPAIFLTSEFFYISFVGVRFHAAKCRKDSLGVLSEECDGGAAAHPR